MPESTCLHIQDRESGPIRVVELPWISVRIGRAAYCEVRLADERVASEACRLARKGRTWSLIPTSGQDSIIFIDGRVLEAPCPVPFDLPFRIGPYCLTLRHDVTAEPDWDLFPAIQARALEPSANWDRPAPARASASAGLRSKMSPPTPPSARPEPAARSAGDDPDRWRARWKAAEAHLRARNTRLGDGGQRVVYPAPTDGPGETPSLAPHPIAKDVIPADSSRRPAPPSGASRIEPGWSAARAVPRAMPPSVERVERSPLSSWASTHDARPPATAAMPAAPEAPEPAHADEPLFLTDTATWFDTPDEVLDAVAEPAPPAEASTITTPSAEEVEAVASPGFSADRPDAEPTCETSDEPASVVAVEPPAPEMTHALAVEAEPAGPLASIVDADGERVEEPGVPPRAGRVEGSRKASASGPSSESAAGIPRASERGPRKRRPPRERMGPGRRGESPRRGRDLGDSRRSPPDEPASDGAPDEPDWPSVRDILANHAGCAGPRPTVERAIRGPAAMPTVPREPACWRVPAAVVLPPVCVCVLGIGVLASALSFGRAAGSANSAIITQRLLAGEIPGRHRPLPPTVWHPTVRWIGTSAQQLASWAVYLAGAGKTDRLDPSEPATLAERALEVSPLNPTARLVMSQIEAQGPDGTARIRGLALSRDSVSQAWSARRLIDAGHRDAGLQLYRRALIAATKGGLSRTASPRFPEDGTVRHYLIPGEDAVRDIVRELAGRDDWSFADWSPALPDEPSVWLAAARVLRARGKPEAEPILDRILAENRPAADDTSQEAHVLAARAEALVLRSRWKEAAEQYRRAIELADNDRVRRSWWFNLADIAQRLDDERQEQTAIRAAMAVRQPNSDDIAQRASLVQRLSAARRRERIGTARAN